MGFIHVLQCLRLSPAKDNGKEKITGKWLSKVAGVANARAESLHPGVRRRSHVDCVSIREQEWLAISQGSDSWNGPSGTLCHLAWVRACPIDPAQLSEPVRGTRLKSSKTGLHSQGLWMNNTRVAFLLHTTRWENWWWLCPWTRLRKKGWNDCPHLFW